MIIDPNEPDGGVPGDNESIPGNSDDDSDSIIDTGDYLDGDGGTGRHGPIGDDDGLDPDNSEDEVPDGGDPVNDAVSLDPNESSDGDEITVNPDGSASIDEDRLSGGHENVEDVIDEVRNIVGGRSNGALQAGEITALGEQLRNPHESLARMGESTGDSSNGGLLAADATGVAAVVAIGAAVLAGGGGK